MRPDEREKLIAKLEARRREIEKAISSTFGDANARAHDQHRQVSRQLGKLLLQRDREHRPEIYRREGKTDA